MIKNSKKYHLTKFMKLDVNSIQYNNDIDNGYSLYNSVEESFGLKNYPYLVYPIVEWLWFKDITLKSLVAKGRSEKDFFKDLFDVLKKQSEYYESYIYKDIYEKAKNGCTSISDLDIVLREERDKYSIFLPLLSNNIPFEDLNQDPLISITREKFQENNGYVDKLFQLMFFEPSLNSKLLNTESIENVIDESIEKYNLIKNNKKSLRKKQVKNPFLILYMYMRSNYIKSRFKLSLLDEKYFENLNFDINIETKKDYTLRDISEYLSILISVKPENCYARLRKCFKEHEVMNEYKKNKNYSFPNIIIPISYYLFYSKKHNINKREKDIFCGNKIIEYRIKPILKAYLNNDEQKLRVLSKFTRFLEKEFEDIVESESHRYQYSMISFWNDILLNIYYRAIGLESKLVYQNL